MPIRLKRKNSDKIEFEDVWIIVKPKTVGLMNELVKTMNDFGGLMPSEVLKNTVVRWGGFVDEKGKPVEPTNSNIDMIDASDEENRRIFQGLCSKLTEHYFDSDDLEEEEEERAEGN